METQTTKNQPTAAPVSKGLGIVRIPGGKGSEPRYELFDGGTLIHTENINGRADVVAARDRIMLIADQKFGQKEWKRGRLCWTTVEPQPTEMQPAEPRVARTETYSEIAENILTGKKAAHGSKKAKTVAEPLHAA